MARVERLKRRLVRQAVRENLDLIAGRSTPRRVRSTSHWRIGAWGAALLLLLSLTLLSSTHAVTELEPGPFLRQWEQDTAAPAAGSAAVPAGVPPQSAAAPPPVPQEASPPAPVSLRAADLARPVAPQVFPLAVRRVVLDPGHGGQSIGTRTPSGLTEKELTLDIARRLEGLLTASGFEVLMTRRDDRAVALEERARQANLAEADLFVSIHVNWIDDGAATRGIETYYLGTTDDPYVTELAAKENRESGYALADLRRLLDRIYSDLRGGKSRELAESVQAALHQSLSKVNPQLQDRGVKTAPFLVLVETEMPAILAEVSCLSNEKEARLLTKPLYRQFIAEALARGIETYAGAPRAASRASTAGP